MSELKLPPQLRVIERGWLSSNSVIFHEGESATVVDSGYVSHAQQTVELVRRALGGRRLDRIVNTHAHSDHIGGNAALQRAFGCSISVPQGMAAAISAWDEEALMLTPSGQRGDRFRHDATLAPGDEFELGGMTWRALHAPGHDMNALVFHCESRRILISGDALWRDGFGIQFAEILGQAAGLAATRQTLESLGRLAVEIVIPGHGAAFTEFDDAMERALQRVAAFEADPQRMARNALKACFIFNLLELRSMRRDRVAAYLCGIAFFNDINNRILHKAPEELADWLVAELQRAGAVDLRGGELVPTKPA